MKRAKRHKIKNEIPETSTARSKDNDEHDLAYYIHDRVELMHQVFSVIKPKELKSLTPDCVRHISLDDLQELCTEELLGISSKRLCAILDGAEPPSDTESSCSSPELETISLDSISSDDEILSQPSSKGKKHRHKKRKSKSKHKHRNSKQDEEKNNEEQSKATRAGLTVLELLELQARARAIRAQLQQDRRESPEHPEAVKTSTSDDEVEIKEEPAEVVEISSDEEKPNIKELEKQAQEPQTDDNQVTKRINDFIITVPQAKKSRTIKLNRSKAVPIESPKPNEIENTPKEVEVVKEKEVKSKRKQKKKQKNKEKDSDHDEITLQLSDTEKMDLLENFDRKNYDNVTSEDSESSSDTDSDKSDNESENIGKRKKHSNENLAKTIDEASGTVKMSAKIANKNTIKINNKNSQSATNKDLEKSSNASEISNINEKPANKCSLNKPVIGEDFNNSNDVSVSGKTNDLIKVESGVANDNFQINKTTNKSNCDISDAGNIIKNPDKKLYDHATINEEISGTNPDKLISKQESLNTTPMEQKHTNLINTDTKNVSNLNLESINIDVRNTQNINNENATTSLAIIETNDNSMKSSKQNSSNDNSVKQTNLEKSPNSISIELNNVKETIKKNTTRENEPKICEIDVEEGEINDTLSDGEISETAHSEVVCISDEEIKKKKKKKEKKSKKENFRDRADQNFYKESCVETDETTKIENDTILKRDSPRTIIIDDDIYELSDDSSCFEVEGTVLSKEPTTEEIVALSAKIDDTIDKEEDEEQKDLEISWKDRYLDSKKVKKVLSTSNILNALRKKNKELKKKLEVKKLNDLTETKEIAEEKDLMEGSIDQYNTLEGSTKYVDPITIVKPQDTTDISKEMEKDAKQLLKMYKKLLKYNDMNRHKDPNKKKKKKTKKKKDKEKNI